ncbi:D-2-hydroxyacid dehydrogenase [Paenibacillus beijingensis]|uniref:D-2-hydroxyacid dehydrogenase n=1 Tax=Paenibacillus beijingensis TaxID=1126833 RepID=UPI0006988F69|nr:D-2-hydroxyacid dehydrogenase [Paenibacillus beijingensis]
MIKAGAKPNLLIRCDIDESALRRIRTLANEVHVEPWKAGGREPQMLVRPEGLDIVVTRGLIDPVAFRYRAHRLKWIHSVTVGVEKLDVLSLAQSGIIVTNVKGLNAVPIAEYVMGALLAWNRGLFTFAAQQRRKVWQTLDVKETSGSTMGILGYGSIGREVAVRAKAFGMNVLASSRREHGSKPHAVDRFFLPDEVESLLAEADCVVNCLPLSPETANYMNRRRFECMKDDSLFINVGRGRTVDEDALLCALRNRSIGGAVLDVFGAEPLPPGHPLWDEDRVLISPHNAFASPKHWGRVFDHFIENLERFCKGDELLHAVDPVKGY